MSLSMWLDKTGNHERPTAVQVAVGGNKPTWATVNASIALAVWPKNSVTARSFLRRDIVGTHVIVTNQDLGAKAGDRIRLGSAYYMVNGFELFNNAAVGGETCYALDTTLRTV